MGNFDPQAAGVPLATIGAAANTYSDLNGLAALKRNPESPQAIHAVAEQVDALFLQMMLKSMRDAGEAVGEGASNELGMYQDLFDKQIALSLSARGGLGVGAMIARQLETRAGAAAPAAPAGMDAAVGTFPGPVRASTGPGNVPTAVFRPDGGAGPAAAPAELGAAGAAAAPAELEATRFVGAVLPTIRAAAHALGVNPIGLLAQAALETGWGRRMARTASGAPSLNLFGIKADDRWTGARAVAPTVEFAGGVATMRRAAFRAYGSIAESVADFAKLLRGSPRFRDAVAAGHDVRAYIDGIAKAGYATDPQYANKLNQIVDSGLFRAAVRASAAEL